MSDALDDFAADLAEQNPCRDIGQPHPFARTFAAYAELLRADAAVDVLASTETFDSAAYALVAEVEADAVQKVREAIADDTCAYNERELILSLHESMIRDLAAQLSGVPA